MRMPSHAPTCRSAPAQRRNRSDKCRGRSSGRAGGSLGKQVPSDSGGVEIEGRRDRPDMAAARDFRSYPSGSMIEQVFYDRHLNRKRTGGRARRAWKWRHFPLPARSPCPLKTKSEENHEKDERARKKSGARNSSFRVFRAFSWLNPLWKAITLRAETA
jgi:hypothetical protein